LSLLQICTRALEEIGGFDVPGSFYGNSNPTAKQCLRLVEREGSSLEKESRWTALITSTTITTVSGTATYALSTYAPGFRAFANMSQWDRTNYLPLRGPLSGAQWQYRKSGLVTTGSLNRGFRIAGTSIAIDPTPSSADTLAFDYYDSRWIVDQSEVAGTYVTQFTSDNDTCRLDEDLLTMGLKWRFLQAKGMPYQPEYAEYESVKTSLLEDEAGKGPICLGAPTTEFTNIPDTGFGS
jgi:hypothetical protein